MLIVSPWLILFGLVWLTSESPRAYQRFTSSTSLLTLDVSVLDRDGNPVAGLAPDDFIVTLNKESSPVRTMAFLGNNAMVTAGGVRVSSDAGSAADSHSAVAEAGASEPKLLVIMVDDKSIYPTDSKGLFVAAERFIGTIPDRDWVGLASTSGRVTVDPSLDRSVLMKSLGHTFGWMDDPRRDCNISNPFVGLVDSLEAELSGSALLRVIGELCQVPPGSKNLGQLLAENGCARAVGKQVRANAAFARNSTHNQLDAYQQVIRAMGAAPGVKQLVILTGGIALNPIDSLDFVPVAKAAAAAGVQITMLMEDPDPDPGNCAGGLWGRDQLRMLQQAQTLAEMSGGQFFRVIGQADRFYQRVLKASAAIYRLGVDLPKGAPPDGTYKVSVEVKRRGVTVLASQYAVPPPPPVVLTPEEQMTKAISSGMPAYALPVQLTAEVGKAVAESPASIRISVDVPGDSRGPIAGILGVLGPDKLLRTTRHALSRSGDGTSYILDLIVPAAAGTYEIRFAAADASGAVGAVTRTVVVKVPEP